MAVRAGDSLVAFCLVVAVISGLLSLRISYAGPAHRVTIGAVRGISTILTPKPHSSCRAGTHSGSTPVPTVVLHWETAAQARNQVWQWKTTWCWPPGAGGTGRYQDIHAERGLSCERRRHPARRLHHQGLLRP